MLQTGAVAQSPIARTPHRRRPHTGLLLRQAKSDYQARQSVRKSDGRSGRRRVDISFYRRIQTRKGHDTKGFLTHLVIV